MAANMARVSELVRLLYMSDHAPNGTAVSMVVQNLINNNDSQMLKAYVNATRYLLERESATSIELRKCTGVAPSHWSIISPYHRGIITKPLSSATRGGPNHMYTIPDGKRNQANNYIEVMEELIGVLNES